MTQPVKLNINKKSISQNIHLSVGTSKKNIDKITQDVVEAVIETLIQKQKINIKNFGSFKIQQKKSRIGRNPKTLEIYEINERSVTIFKTSNYLKLQINTFND